MVTVTIPKKEYQHLVDKALRYEYLRQILKEDVFAPPSVKNPEKIIKAFKKTGLYNQSFLQGLKKGLGRSSYFRGE